MQAIFRALGERRAGAFELLHPRAMLNTVRSLWAQGWANGNLKGEGRLLGGIVFVARGGEGGGGEGEVVFWHKEEVVGDRADLVFIIVSLECFQLFRSYHSLFFLVQGELEEELRRYASAAGGRG